MNRTMKKRLLSLALALFFAVSAVASNAFAAAGDKPKITVKRKYVWKGYGFLPGYPRTERERARERYYATGGNPRYIDRFGRVSYGFGGPGFYGGQYNGGSFGPCWTSTPIGMMWNCGR